MSAYLVVNYQVDDAEAYKAYQGGAGPALKIGAEGAVLALDPATTQLEGEGAGSQTVILRYDSVEQAKEIYESGAYQEVLPVRLGATSKHFAVLVNGVD